LIDSELEAEQSRCRVIGSKTSFLSVPPQVTVRQPHRAPLFSVALVCDKERDESIARRKKLSSLGTTFVAVGYVSLRK
jgi:hypothetical protein